MKRINIIFFKKSKITSMKTHDKIHLSTTTDLELALATFSSSILVKNVAKATVIHAFNPSAKADGNKL